jgi:hypothetical protein
MASARTALTLSVVLLVAVVAFRSDPKRKLAANPRVIMCGAEGVP